MSLVRVYSPYTESEVAVISSLFEAHNIPYFIHGRNIGSIYPGLQINAYNTQSFMVPEECSQDAIELLRQFRETKTESSKPEPISWLDKMRIVIEALLFGWFVPGKRSHKDKS